MNIRADMKPLFTDKILAAGDVYLDEKVVIHNVKLIQAEKDGQTYSFVSFPEKKKNDKWEPIIMIKDKQLREAITDEVKKSVMHQINLDKEPLQMTVDVRLYEKDETRAYATLNYGGLVKIDGIRIFERDGDLHISYPYEKTSDRYQNVAGPASPGIRKQMAVTIIKAYEDKKLEKSQNLDPVQGNETPDPDYTDPSQLPWNQHL